MTGNRQFILLLGDLCALILSYSVMTLIRPHGHAHQAFLLFMGVFVLWMLVLYIFDLYTLRRINPNPQTIGLLAIAIGVNIALGAIVFYLHPEVGIAPKINLLIVGGFAFVFLALWRRCFYLFSVSHFRPRIIVIGSGVAEDHLVAELGEQSPLGKVILRAPRVPEILPAAELVIANAPDLASLIKAINDQTTDVRSVFDAYQELFGKIPLSLMDNGRAMDMVSRGENQGFFTLYRVVEILIASITLIVAAPFLAIAALALLIEDGAPLIYTQTRVGKNGKEFSIYKLRSMTRDAEMHGAAWASRRDKRITRVGHILRKTHLDEVPQMWNIIRGDLALVGPRPERPEFVRELEGQIPYYFIRHSVRPGFTGWAQVRFRYARTVLDSREKFEYDLYYLANQNPLLDFGIFLKTVQIIFTH